VPAQALEIHPLLEQLAQGIEVEGIQLVGRKVLGPVEHHAGGRHQGQAFAALHRHGEIQGHAVGDGLPELFQGQAGPLGTALHQAVGQHQGVHGAGAGAADAVEAVAPVRQQAVEHTPAVGAVGAAALERQIEGQTRAACCRLLNCHVCSSD